MIYRHPKFKHVQEVQESETVRRRLLEQAGWIAESLPASEPPVVVQAPIKKRRGRRPK